MSDEKKLVAENFYPSEKIAFELPPNKRLDKFLAEILKDRISRSQIQKLILEGKVFLEQMPVKENSYQAKKPLLGFIYLPIFKKDIEINPNPDIPLEIVYEDSYFIVVNKSPKLTVHPGHGTKNDTLIHALLSRYPNLPEGHGKDRPGIVHRLDRDTRGLLLVAKNPEVHFKLAKLFQERKITKIYHALVWGSPLKEAKIEGYIRRNPKDRKKMQFIFQKEGNCREAKLSYRTISYYSFYSLVEIYLETGRTHQIRATFSSLGYPILADPLYSETKRLCHRYKVGKEKRNIIEKSPLFLQASILKFTHPFTHKAVSFTLPLPPQWDIFLQAPQKQI